jgi:hypothetical protein
LRFATHHLHRNSAKYPEVIREQTPASFFLFRDPPPNGLAALLAGPASRYPAADKGLVDRSVRRRMHTMRKPFRTVFFAGAIAAAFAAAPGIAPALAQTTQQHVHQMGQSVMPFDLGKTVHVFRMTDTGGVQTVVVRDARDADQVVLIRQHLRHEAAAFQHGDYADPMSLHGATMPGVSELAGHPRAIAVSYAELPLGAAITFRTQDRHLVTAVHRWFGAQLSEHGADARAE